MVAKKKAAKKASPKKAKDIVAKTKKESTSAGKKLLGVVTHFFDKISVAVVEVKSPVSVGDEITIEGPQTNVKMKITSMQVEHTPLKTAKKGDDIGMKVPSAVRAKDLVYKA